MGKSTLIDEMPLEDTAGVKSALEMSINWLYFILFCFLAYYVSQLIYSEIPSVVNILIGVLFMLPYGITWVMNSNLLPDQVKGKIQTTVVGYMDERFEKKVDTAGILPMLLPAMRIFFLIGSFLISFGIAFSRFFSSLSPINLLLLAAFYFWIFLITIGKQLSYSLVIGSKTMKGAGINIPGASFFSLLSRNANITQTAMGAGPARDAEQVTREIGAVLMDIRQLGDTGIQKWKV
jgi:hypothetical protein